MDSEKLIELGREHNELYDLSYSKCSNKLHKERLWEETEEEMKQTGKLNTF
jgi:hypothetical protein